MSIEMTVSEIAEVLGLSRQAINNRVKELPEEDITKKRQGCYCCYSQWIDQT